MKKILSLIVLMLGFAFLINADSYKVSFLPSDGMSSYTVKHTDGSGVAYTVGVDDKLALEVDITRESLAYIELSLNSIEKTIGGKKYVFFGWVNQDGDHISYSWNYTGVFDSEMTIKPDFIPEEWAHYVIKNDRNTLYYDLNKAIAKAKAETGAGDGKIVVVDKNGILPKGDYTIPSGVTLLVPGDDSYTCKDVLGKDDLVNENQTSSVYRTWTIESGTNITVNGKVCIYSKLICYSGVVFGRPYQYGHVIMQDDTKMTLESGAKLSAFGYITGSLQSSIEAKSGAVVYECFQIRDWRGGNASADMILENYNTLDLGMARLINAASVAGLGDGKPNYYGVFPFSHYYIQNIETPLLIRKGADERLVTGVDVGLGLTFVDIAFIGQQGLFALGDNSYFTKYYDVNTDRVKFAIKGETESATASFGTISLPAKLTDDLVLEICSKDYTLPIAHNIDIMLENVDITIQDNFALLAGSTLFVDKNSKVVVNGGGSDYTRWTQVKEYLISAKLITETIKKTSSIYIYDKEWNNGYFGMYNASLLTVGARPEGMQFTRTSVEDAKVVVDGTIELSQYGFVYTTKGENCGANITSNGGGSIKYGTLGSATKTLQVTQSETNITYVDIPVDNAKLRNADGTYETPTANTTYYYCDGTWGSSNCEKVSDPVDYTPIFTASIDEITAYMEEESGTGILNITSGNQLVTNPAYTYSITGRDARMFNYEPAAKIVTFTPASVGEKTATLILTATYTNNEKEYKHTEAITLTGKALNYAENTLAFNDLSTIYVGKQNISLFKNKNNENDITITIGDNNEEISIPNASGIFNALKEGEVTITLSQDADEENNIAATTISTTLTINPRVVWNWGTLYYPSVNENPVSVLDGSTGWALTEIIDPKSGDVVNFIGTSPETYEAEIFDLINGEYSVQFKFKQGNEEIVFNSEIYRDPRIVRVNVNEERTYQAVTVGDTEEVSYKDGIVSIESGSQTNSWTIHFLGVPDKLYFIPTGERAWLIEESENGSDWETTLPWEYLVENEQFEHSLKPSTQYVRVSYAADGTGTMRDVYITKLEGVKISPNKLYMPATVGAQKGFTLAYVSDDVVSILDPNGMFTANPSNFPASSNEAPYYKEVDVVVKNNSCEEEKLINMNISSSLGTVQLPIQAYNPQQLPIVLAADHKERFYYVTSETVQTTWDEQTHTITMHNAIQSIPNVKPSMTFFFEGAPSYISFNYTNKQGVWKIEQSADGTSWSSTTTESATTDYIKQSVNPTSKYIRVTYESLYAEKVDITNLMIIGEAGAFATPAELLVEDNATGTDFSVTAINLAAGMTVSVDNNNFRLSYGSVAANTTLTLNSNTAGYEDVFAENVMKEIGFKAYFNGAKAVDYATITVYKGDTLDVLATIKVTGVRKTLSDGTINIYTGVPDGNGDAIEGATIYSLKGNFVGSGHEELNISNAFASGALFDYLFIFGETTTTDGTTTITTPTSLVGSNAKTPCYIYKKNGVVYEYYSIIENANSGTKITQDFLKLIGDGGETLSVYITGFCPYASTGYTKEDEGVFFFQGGAGDEVDVYLENCYIYSRSKTDNGRFFENRSDGQSFTEGYVRGSGGVLVFECSNDNNSSAPFNVTIHTRGTNMLKSHYGCFLESVAGRAYQVSSPVQVHMKDETFISASYTTLSFDDIWPIAGETTERTNGFISLQKQVNNAPSIDMGNAKTVVNFNGGQVELQNAQNVSDNYTSTLAISHREGTFAGFRLAYGLGSDGVGGTVNFNDGTTTVITMPVEERYRQYYLMDKGADGIELTTTSCLRCPQNTYVYGGSHCMMRACSEPTSKGGAPKDGPDENGKLLGLYKFPKNPADGKKGGWSDNGTNGLVTPTTGYVPEDYNVNSVTPNDNGTDDLDDDYLNFWFDPNFEPAAKPEVDQKVSFWKACMTEIGASYAGYGGVIGGDIKIGMEEDGNQTELVSNLLYCTIDQNIHDVIRGDYSAPVKSPLPSGDAYLYVKPTSVGANKQHYVLNNNNYQIENKIYYITTATADTWMTFTAPFDVANVYIMETCNEDDLVDYSLRNFDPIIDESEEEVIVNPREETLKLQARYNADFAAFFGVAMAIHPNKTFDQIYGEYEAWARSQNIAAGKYPLIPYRVVVDENGKEVGNWKEANCYIYKNTEDWELDWESGVVDGEVYNDPVYTPKWGYLETSGSSSDASTISPMLVKGQTYSMLFPYCVGCDNSLDERQEWDYWSGKFLIFESTKGPHTINGGSFVGTMVNENTLENGKIEYEFVYDQISIGDQNTVFAPEVSDDKAILTGNSTFTQMITNNANVFAYAMQMNEETFVPVSMETPIEPTTSFLLAYPPQVSGNSVMSISRMGKIKYRTGDNNGDDTPTGEEHVPTVGGGSDIFVTSVAEGINISVSEPQYVGVFSATGALLYSGWVETSVDVNLVVNGVYVVVGENNSVKVIY